MEESKDEELVQQMRNSNRMQMCLVRKKQKNEESDVRRSLANKQISHSDIVAIIEKLKTKTSVSALDLKALQNALYVDGEKTRELVLSTHGALRGIVGELTGNDVQKQIGACGCLNNLALGDGKTCSVTAKAAGAYLITGLDSMSQQFAGLCCYTLGNLFASGAPCCEYLLGLGAIKLCDVTPCEKVSEGAVFALSHLAANMRDGLILDHLERILQFVTKIEINLKSSKLLFILSCHRDFTHHLLPETYLQEIINKIPLNINNYLRHVADENIKEELNFLLRVLSNINSNKIYKGLVVYFLENNMADSFKALLKENNSSVMWFLGNLMESCGESDFFKYLCDWRTN